jgi:tripeptide aminopeptidase
VSLSAQALSHSGTHGDASFRTGHRIKYPRWLQPLPRDRLSPETTEGREGFVNPMSSFAQENEATLSLNLRDFKSEKLAEHLHLLRRLAGQAADAYPGPRVDVEIVEAYRNMKEYLKDHPLVAETVQ